MKNFVLDVLKAYISLGFSRTDRRLSGRMEQVVTAQRSNGAAMLSTLFALIVTPAFAIAQPDLRVQMVAEKEITVIENGEEVKRRVPTLEIDSGADLYFTLRIRNEGDEVATNVVVDNPIPEETTYVEGSAGGEDSEILFSVNNGETWAPADELTYEFTTFSGETEERKARPEMYTDIRWVVEDVPPGAQGDLFFQVRVN